MEQITASAGSGKTYTLTRRFLTRLAKALPDGGSSLCLLEEGTDGQNSRVSYSLAGILAATFTNKAATEMQARVIRELKQQALAPGAGDKDFPLTPDEARRWLAVILRRFDAVNIRTIDSLLTLLVRLNALPLSLPPDFAPLFSLEEATEPLYDALLDRAGGDAAMENLFRNACRSLLFHNRAKGVAAGHMLRARLAEVVRLHLDGSPLPDEEHGKKAASLLASLHAAMCGAGDVLAGFFQEENLAANAHARNFLNKCRACPVMTIPDFADSFAHKRSLDEWLNQSSKGKGSQDAHAAFADFLTAYHELKERGPALRSTVEFMPLIALAEPLMEGIDALQREDGLVPASRLPALARASLESGGGVSDAFCRLGDTLAHLLFDEFQDTSTDQWHAITPLVVESLSRGGSLTYVGDVKQAIYGWRGGNAALFDAVAQNRELTVMLENGPERTTLPHNWRSAPPIVAANNQIFGPLADVSFARRVLEAMLPAKTTPELLAETSRGLAAAFAGCEQQVPEKNKNKTGFVQLRRIEAGNAAALMSAVRETLHELLGNLLRRRSPGEIAVLVRKNSEAADVAAWLTEWRIPVVTEHSFCLGAHPIIIRLVDTLAFLEYPPDDAAFWSAASGPELFAHLNGPDENALSEWLARTRAESEGGPLFAAFRRSFPHFWRQTLAPFLDQAGLLSAYDTVCELIRHCRLFERFPEHAPFLRRFAEVAHAAETNGLSSLSAFLEHWSDAGSSESVPMPEAMDAVRIISMHKAKGLEFPVVVAPFHHQSDPAARPLAITEDYGMPLIYYRPNYDAESVRSMAEQINLLYVSWTRPTEELYAFITQSARSASRSSIGKALSALLEDIPFTDGVYECGQAPQAPPAAFEPKTEGAPAPVSVTDAPMLQADPTEAKPSDEEPAPLMAWLPRLKIFRNPLDGKGFSERQRGLLAHACLENLQLTGDLPDDVKRAVDQGLRAFPVPMPDPESVRRDMVGMLEWYASLPDVRTWMRHGSPEQPVMDVNGNLRRIDLLVDAPDSPLLAVEYKTGQPSPDHVLQVECYLSLLASAVRRKQPDRAVKGVVVYLDSRRLEMVAKPEHLNKEDGNG